MFSDNSAWFAVDHGPKKSNIEFLRLATSIPFHIKLTALRCMDLTQVKKHEKIRQDMHTLVQRVVRRMEEVLKESNMSSATATKHIMSALDKVTDLQTHSDGCSKALKQCKDSVQSAWRQMRLLASHNQLAAHQKDMILHSLAYDHRLVQKVKEVWDKAARSALRESNMPKPIPPHFKSDERKVSTQPSRLKSLPPEFKSNRLRYLPHVLLALTVTTAGFLRKKHRPNNSEAVSQAVRPLFSDAASASEHTSHAVSASERTSDAASASEHTSDATLESIAPNANENMLKEEIEKPHAELAGRVWQKVRNPNFSTASSNEAFKYFYQNIKTGQTQFEIPPDLKPSS